jgi:hypothetical protein
MFDDPAGSGAANPNGWLYGFACDGTDRSADYLLNEVARDLGHRSTAPLGFTTLLWAWDPAVAFPTGSDTESESCYVNGQIVSWRSDTCLRYRQANGALLGNGNCTPSWFTLIR